MQVEINVSAGREYKKMNEKDVGCGIKWTWQQEIEFGGNSGGYVHTNIASNI